MLAYMTLWYVVSILTKRTDVVDSAWGLGFVVTAWLTLAIYGNWRLVSVLSACLVSLWGIRLFAHVAGRNWRKTTDDHRYTSMRAKWGRDEKRKIYTNIFLLQGALVLLVSAPMIAIGTSQAGINAGVWLGWIVWLFGIVYEAVADRQLSTFLGQRPTGSHAIMQKGLWKYSRHPNYFGEITTWWGASFVAVCLGYWWGVLGSLAITVLITKISGLPPLEKHYADNADYKRYAKNTPALIPFVGKKGVHA